MYLAKSVAMVSGSPFKSAVFICRERAVTPVWARVRISSFVGGCWTASESREVIRLTSESRPEIVMVLNTAPELKVSR